MKGYVYNEENRYLKTLITIKNLNKKKKCNDDVRQNVVQCLVKIILFHRTTNGSQMRRNKKSSAIQKNL